jgi:hypothetical protein
LPARFLRALPAITIPGSSHIAYSTQILPLIHPRLALLALVEMLITTSTAELPGVTAPEGLKLHCACAGSPAVQAKLTAPVNDAPTGRILRAYGPEVCPAVTVWLAVEEVTRKSWANVNVKLAAWVGAPDVSCVLMIIGYTPGVASFGMLMVAVMFVLPPLATEIGLAGVSVHIAAASALASHVAFTFPAYEKDEVSFRFSVTCAPGVPVAF